MKQNTTDLPTEAAVAAAIGVLAILDIEVVDRCPSADCPVCGPALPIAA